MLKKLKNWLFPNYEGEFEYSAEGFNKARRWAKNQPHPQHPDHPRLSLWDYVKGNWVDSEYKLHEINKRKKIADERALRK